MRQKTDSKKQAFQLPKHRFLLLSSLVIIMLTSLIYYQSLDNQLTQWDDDIYVTNNPDITTLSSDFTGTIKKSFSTYVNGNYHPITMLSFCKEYFFFQLNPKVFHTTNLILHLLNSLLVLLFIWLLTKQQLTAFITALLFAIHPMHVESVAWVSERKDLLYCFFFLASLCTYLLYIKTDYRKKLFYALTLLLFLLSCLSKAMAVSLVLVLFLIDYYQGREFSRKTIIEKLPFFVLSIVFGIVAIQAQKSVGALGNAADYNIFERILFSGYGLMMYVWKLFVPIENSCFYNYPVKENGTYPLIIYFAPFLIIAFSIVAYKVTSLKKELFFAGGFFLITIALVLQLLPVGSAIIAERYTYIPYIGAFYFIAFSFQQLLETKNNLKNVYIGLSVIVVIALSSLTHKASLLWKDGVTLLEHAAKVEKFEICSLHHKNLAIAHFYTGQYAKAIEDYTSSIKKTNDNISLYCDRGVTYYQLKQYDKAIEDFNYVLQHDSTNLNAYHYRGISYFETDQHLKSVQDMSKAILLNSVFVDHYYKRGLSNYILGNYSEALKDYNYLIAHQHTSTDVYNNHGLILLKMNRYEDAIIDFTNALQFNPQNANAYFNRGLAYENLNQYEKAISEYTKAIELNPSYGYSFSNRAYLYNKTQQYQLALQDAIQAQQMGINMEEQFMNMLNEKTK